MNRVTPSRPGLPRHRNRPGRPRALVAQVSMLAGQTILLATLALAPWFFGGVQARRACSLLAEVQATLRQVCVVADSPANGTCRDLLKGINRTRLTTLPNGKHQPGVMVATERVGKANRTT